MKVSEKLSGFRPQQVVVLLAALVFAVGAHITFAQSPAAGKGAPSNKQLASPEIERKVDALLKKMGKEPEDLHFEGEPT